jgi:CTP synthase (UTP-ammonia lyase)
MSIDASMVRAIPMAIVSDFNPRNQSHMATDDAIGHCSVSLGLSVEHRWIRTSLIKSA